MTYMLSITITIYKTFVVSYKESTNNPNGNNHDLVNTRLTSFLKRKLKKNQLNAQHAKLYSTYSIKPYMFKVTCLRTRFDFYVL